MMENKGTEAVKRMSMRRFNEKEGKTDIYV